MNSKLKNLILIILLAILIILGIGKMAFADGVKHTPLPSSFSSIEKGNQYVLNYNDLNQEDTFCIQHNQKLEGDENRDYIVKNIIKIKGSKAWEISYDKKGNVKWINEKSDVNDYNLKLAAAVYYSSITKKYDGNTQRQLAVWYYMHDWMKNIGKKFSGIDTGITSDNNEGLNKGVKNRVRKYVKKQKKQEANESDAYITNYTGSLKAEIYNLDGTDYIKISGYRIDYEPDLNKFDIYGTKIGSTNSEDITISCYALQKETKLGDIRDIEPNEPFELLVPRDIARLDKIELETEKTGDTDGTITLKMAFLQCKENSWQNLCRISVDKDSGTQTSASGELPGIDLLGSLQIEKVDKNNHNIKLGGVGFTLKNSDGKYVDSNGQITDTETTLYTDEYGNRTISNIPIGSYTFTETINPHYGYEVTPESITINIQGGQNSKVVENEQKYIKITGKVWEDVQEGKGSTRNNQLDEEEHILGTKTDPNNIWTDNVKVYLKKFERDSNNKLTGRVNTIGNYTTTWDGAYGFDNVEVKYLEDYFVEFEYNGLTYQCVNSGIGDLLKNENSSKAGEDAKSRENLNNKFSIIENGGSANKGVAKDPTENNKIGLDYTINDHVATLNGREDYYKEGWNTTSNTYNALLNLNDYYKYLRGDKGNGHPVSKIDEISNVNLGLYKRKEPDLAVQKDVQNVQVEINGYGHTYNYDRKETLEKQNNEDAFNVGVKFGSKYTEGYELPIYESDSNYINEKDPSKELKVYITYKVRLRNQATTIDSKINSLVDYYDSTYEKNGNCDIRINENINDTDKDGKLNSTIEFSKSDYNDKYKKLNINTKGISIGAGETKCIYIQFGLSRTQIASIINDKSEEDRILKNFVEINSYSSYYKGTENPYGGIDKDSAPGNAVPGNQSTYEDDTDTAPTLKLEVKEARKLTGKVFLDSTNGTLMTGQRREGDGEYKDGEEGIKDITVTLKPINEDPSYVEYSEKTNENGDFTISGFIPNEYEVIYTWGGQELKNGDKITLDKYKGTAYKERERYTLTGPLWYRQNANKRLTDAIDNYERRQKIDEKYKSIDHTTESTINNIQNEKMNSTTPKMSIRIENMRKRRKNNYIIIR